MRIRFDSAIVQLSSLMTDSWLLIGGTTSSPFNVKTSDKVRDDAGNYLQGVSCDFTNMEKFVQNNCLTQFE